MKRLSPTALLLLLNLVLVLVVACLLKFRPAGGAPERPADQDRRTGGGVPLANRTPPPVSILKTNPFTWAQLESEDYRTYIERLRAVGCPEQTIRDLIIADLDKLLAPQLQAVQGLTNPLAYWQSDEQEFQSGRERRERQRQQRELDFQKREVVRDLLGIDLVAEREKSRGEADYQGRRLGFLPEEKRSQVRMLLERFNDAELALREKVWQEGEPLTAEDQTRLTQLQHDREAAITALLSPAEQQQYDLAMSPTAYKVRETLFGMKPSEQEFLAVFGAQRDFERKWPAGLPDNADFETQARYARDQQQYQAQLKEQLGEDRYAQWQRAQDADYRQLRLAAAQNQVPAEAANEVYEMKRVMERNVAQVMTDEGLSLDRKREIITAMGQEAARSVQGALGDRAFRDYLRSGAGSWMRGPANR